MRPVIRPGASLSLSAGEVKSGKEIAVHEGHELGMLLRKASLSFHRRANAWMLDHGVTADQFVLLTVVAHEPGITQITIVERTGSDPNTVAAVLRRLEQRRLVRREAHARDRRAPRGFLSAPGQRVRRRGGKDAGAVFAPLWGCIADFGHQHIEPLPPFGHPGLFRAVGPSERPADPSFAGAQGNEVTRSCGRISPPVS